MEFLQNDFDKLIADAEAAQNFRLAIRYRFIRIMKKLDVNGAIHFAIDKTNSMYLAEMNETYRAPFSKISRYYEYIWYGKADLPENDYRELAGVFTEFEKSIR